jgi:ribosome maturation factor RimP
MKPAQLQALEQLIVPAVEGQGYEFVDLQWSRGAGKNGAVLRITIDRPIGQGHVSHSDCVRVSREVSALLDVHDVVPGRYQLEVSSPGVDRPLKRPADFLRFIGQRAKVRMRPDALKSNLGPAAAPPPDSKVGPRRMFSGVIEAVDGELIHMQADGVGKVALHTAEMEKANLLFAFNA